MKRILFWCSACLLAGIYIAYFSNITLVFSLIFVLKVLAIVKCIVTKNRRTCIVSLALIMSVLLGICSILIKEEISQEMLNCFNGTTVLLQAKVTGKPKTTEKGTTVTAKIYHIASGTSLYPSDEKISLFIEGNKNILKIGDCVSVKCRITEPDEAYNRDGFDYKLNLKTKGVYSCGYVSEENIELLSSGNYSFSDYFTYLNDLMCKKADEAFSKDNALMLKAIVLGDVSEMDNTLYSAFKNSGLAHAYSVSGTHMAYLSMACMMLAKIFRLKKRTKATLGCSVIILFMLLTGSLPAVVRSAIMVIMTLLAEALDRRKDALTALGLSALILLLINPYSAFNLNFILSFASTLGILVVSTPLLNFMCRGKLLEKENLFTKVIKGGLSTIAVGIGAQLFSFLFVAFLYREVPLFSVVSNLLASPLLFLMLVGGLVFCAISLINMPIATLFAKLLSIVFYIFKKIVLLFGSPEGVLRLGKFGIFFVLIYFAILLVIMFALYKKKELIIYPVVALAFLLGTYSMYLYSIRDTAKVSFLNVGQGDSAHISLPKGIDILIDGGEYINGNLSASSHVVNDYLLKSGVRDIDFMIASHPHTDHIGGLFSVMDYMDVKYLLVPKGFSDNDEGKELLAKARQKGITICELSRGSTIEFSENASIYTIAPDEYLAQQEEKENNKSLVIRFDYCLTSFLFTGDLESDGERYIMRMCDESEIDTDVLKVAHHGSKNTTSDKFLEEVSPQFSFIPVGKNSFGHPFSDVIEKMHEKDITVFRADENKNVEFYVTPNGIQNIVYSEK